MKGMKMEKLIAKPNDFVNNVYNRTSVKCHTWCFIDGNNKQLLIHVKSFYTYHSQTKLKFLNIIQS